MLGERDGNQIQAEGDSFRDNERRVKVKGRVGGRHLKLFAASGGCECAIRIKRGSVGSRIICPKRIHTANVCVSYVRLLSLSLYALT